MFYDDWSNWFFAASYVDDFANPTHPGQPHGGVFSVM